MHIPFFKKNGVNSNLCIDYHQVTNILGLYGQLKDANHQSQDIKNDKLRKSNIQKLLSSLEQALLENENSWEKYFETI